MASAAALATSCCATVDAAGPVAPEVWGRVACGREPGREPVAAPVSSTPAKTSVRAAPARGRRG